MRLSLTILLCLQVFGCALTPLSAAEPVVPLGPEALLRLLPRAPEGWTTKQSLARQDFTDWLFTSAVREFEAPAGGERTALPPTRLRLSLTDTGGWPSRVQAYQTSAQGSLPGESPAAVKLAGYPGTLEIGETSTTATLCIRERFILRVELSPGTARDVETVLGLIDFRGFNAVTSAGETKIANPVRIMLVNELDPKKSRSYLMHWISQHAEPPGITQATP